MKDKVLTIEQMQEFANMGIDISNASMCWSKFKNDIEFDLHAMSQNAFEERIRDIDTLYTPYDYYIIPTFTLQDMLEILPTHKTFSEYNETYNRYWIKLCSPENDNIHIELSNKSLLEAVFNMLKWCKQNNYI